MPRYDKTGPQGLGAKTGRQMGNCDGTTKTGFFANLFGFGRGRGSCCGGRGRGQGFGRGMGGYPLSKEEELKMLEAQSDAINSRIKELKA